MTRLLAWWMSAPLPAWKAVMYCLLPALITAVCAYLDHIFGH